MRRVVITGLGVISPLGRGVEHNWKRLLNGDSGISKIEDIDLKDIPVRIAGRVPWGDGEGEFNPDSVLAPKDQKKNDRFILYGLAAGSDAIQDCGFIPETKEEKNRFGVSHVYGACIRGRVQLVVRNGDAGAGGTGGGSRRFSGCGSRRRAPKAG